MATMTEKKPEEKASTSSTFEASLENRFDRIDERFEGVNDEFKAVRAETKAGFEKVNGEFTEVRKEMKAGFDQVNVRFDQVNLRFDQVTGEIRKLLLGALGVAASVIVATIGAVVTRALGLWV
jgi:tetrahydromethanopterin S-methyltransferase subunit G